MRYLTRLAVFLVVASVVADAPLLGQRQGGPAGRQGGPEGGRGGRPGGPPDGQDGRGGRGRGPEVKTGIALIRGRVINATNGTPVRRASIQATLYAEQGGRTESSRNGTTDDNGLFVFRDLPAGRWALRATKTGYVEQQFGQRSAFASVDPITLAEGQQFVADFRLSRGGAVSGRIIDEFGDPIAGANVTALRYQVTAQGIRTTRAGTSVPSDDTGAYRVYGLPPGQYYISVNDPSAARTIVIQSDLSSNGVNITAEALANIGRDVTLLNDVETTRISYAPTYYPGTAMLADALRLTLGLGEEQSGINMAIVPARTARISGKVMSSNGSPTQATVTLVNRMGQTFSVNSGRGSASDGAFTIANIPPGDFSLDVVGPSVGAAPPEVSSMPIAVNGQDIAGLQITLGAGGRIAGSMTADNGARLPAATTKITAVPIRGGTSAATVNASGTFELEGLLGVYTLRFEGLPNGWTIKSVTANGVDVSDAALEFRPGDRVSMRVELTDRISQVTGTVRSQRSVSGATVVVFPDDPAKWTGTSRFIKTARPTADGQFTIRGLPPHSRYVAVALDFIEPGETQNAEFLQRAKAASAAASFALSAGDQRTLDLALIVR